MEHDSKKTGIISLAHQLESAMQEQYLNKGSFYDSQWKEWNDMIQYSPAPRFRRTKIISWLKKLSVGSLLDVGCGNGEFLLEIQKAIPKVQLTGADVAAELLTSNRLRMPELRFDILNIEKDILPERYDAIVCMEVIEHCTDYQAVIGRLAKMANQWLLLTVPCGPLFEIDRRVGHVKHFNPEEIRQALSKAGMKTIKLQCWGFPFFNLYKHIINLAPDMMSQSFLSARGYSRRQKALSSATYAAFRLSMPRWGYQLFVLATQNRNLPK